MRITVGLRRLLLLNAGQPITLGQQQPLRAGRLRVIYDYPGDPSRLVKIYRHDVQQRGLTHYVSMLQWLRRRYKHTIPIVREMAEWRRFRSAPNPHLQVVHGLINTDLGLGMVVQAVRGPDDQLAPTLREIIESDRYDAATEALFDEFVDWFLSSNVVAADVHTNNLVLDEQRRLFVLIDGSGDKTFIPLRSLFAPLNRRSKLGYIAELKQEVAAYVAARKRQASADNPSPLS